MPPVRDEESETQRKAHAKRVRETRRSTQGKFTLFLSYVSEHLINSHLTSYRCNPGGPEIC